MAQTAWIALALYSFFGFHHLGGPVVQVLDQKINLGNEVGVSIGGLKLSIPKNSLDWGFPLFSLYATGFFYYIAFQKNRSPRATRQYLRNFNGQQLPVELLRNKGMIEVGNFRSHIATFFPKQDPYSPTIKIMDKSGNLSGAIKDERTASSNDRITIVWPDEGLSKETEVLCYIEN